MTHRVVAAAALIVIGRLWAQERQNTEISTDRPDFTEATDTVAVGSVQFETGVLLSQHDLASGPVRDIGGPQSLLRVGLANIAELRLGSNGFTLESLTTGGQRQRHGGGADPQVGAKVRLWEEHRYLPAFAVIGNLTLPGGNIWFTRGSLVPELDLCWSKSLRGGFETGGNVNFLRVIDEHVTEHAASFTVGHGLSRALDAYAEVYRISPIADDEAAHWIANGGIARRLGANMQIDTEVGHSMNARTPYWFIGAGFAIRMSGLTLPWAPRRDTRATARP
ncbi:MAG TPA: transporter [Bryobacteraceae bacterium]|nr:transporter [Bryobacteraceae bacterium]